jgi:GntR family transcriptional regulator
MPLIQFFINQQSGVPAYLQLVQQVQHATRMGLLQPGDQLPTVKEVAAQLALNPNTILRAYHELGLHGLVETRRGLGTFVAADVRAVQLSDHAELRAGLARWVRQAQAAGLNAPDMRGIFESVIGAGQQVDVA